LGIPLELLSFDLRNPLAQYQGTDDLLPTPPDRHGSDLVELFALVPQLRRLVVEIATAIEGKVDARTPGKVFSEALRISEPSQHPPGGVGNDEQIDGGQTGEQLDDLVGVGGAI